MIDIYYELINEETNNKAQCGTLDSEQNLTNAHSSGGCYRASLTRNYKSQAARYPILTEGL